MHRAFRNITTGGVNEDSISEILGTKFKQFVNLIKRNSFSPFLFDTYSPKEISNISKHPGKKDIHYDFTEFFVSAVDAFKKIEIPIIEKSKISESYASKMSAVYDELLKGPYTTGALNADTKPFEFEQMPYIYQDSKIKYLVDGFNLLPFDEYVYFDKNDSEDNALINAIRYLRHFIALLNLDNLTGLDVINFLKKDQFFENYVDGIFDIFVSGSEYFIEGTDFPDEGHAKKYIKNGIYYGLAGIADKIIKKFKNISILSNAKKINYSSFETLNTNDDNETKTWLKTNIFNDDDDDLVEDIWNNFDALDFTNYKGVDATPEKLGIDNEKIRKYAINALYNPIYMSFGKPVLDSNDFSEMKKNAKHFTGGSRTALSANANDDDKMPALSFLYGPKYKDDKYYLVNQDTQGSFDNANLINDDIVKKIYEIDVDDNKKGVVPTILDSLYNPDDNWERIILLQIVTFMIKKLDFVTPNKPFQTLTNDDKKNIVKQIKVAFEGYKKLQPILKELANDKDHKNFSDFRDVFVNNFINHTFKYFDWNTNDKKIVQRTDKITYPKKTANNLAIPAIKKFFFDVVIKDTDFYDEFFNLMRTETSKDGEPINDNVGFNAVRDLEKDDDELKKYRLNVKKISGFTQFGKGCRMVGGNFGDIVLISLIPIYPLDGTVEAIYITKRDYIDAEKLKTADTDAIRKIGRDVYFRKPGTDEIKIYGQTINIKTITADSRLRTYFSINYHDLFKESLNDADPYKISSSSTWNGLNIILTEEMLRDASKWVRVHDASDDNYGNFVYKVNGQVEDVKEDGACSFINESVNKCLDILSSCASSSIEDGKVAYACEKIMEFSFDFGINPSGNDLANKISKMNPRIAYLILKQFKFGSYLSDEENIPFKGIRRYKVQSVSDWLREMGAGSDRCREPVAAVERPCNPKPLREQLGEETVKRIIEYAGKTDKRSFFDYLQTLVNWVNANFQVLNPEEFHKFEQGRSWPKNDDKFNTYDYLNPYGKINIRMKSLSCGLERLKSSIVNDTAGARGADLMSVIATIPTGIEMPLARPGFTYAVPSANLLYGGSSDVEDTFKNLSRQYGYELFKDIFDYLKTSMSGLQTRMKLKSTTEQNISNKLEKFRVAEEELRKSLINLIERNQLYKASQGFINAYDMDDENFKKVLEKHSNLLNISSAYNRKARNLIDLFQTIAKAVTDKIENGQTIKSSSGRAYDRPLSPTYYNPKY